MPTTVTKLIGSGGDYSTLQAWEDAAPANLVSSDQIWRGEIKAASDAFTAALTIAGSTVDSTRYKELTTAAGASFRDDASIQTNPLRYGGNAGATISFGGSAISISEDFVRLSNLQVNCSYTGGYARYAVNNTGLSVSGTTLIENCILENSGSSVNSFVLLLTGSGSVIRNCLLVQRRSGASLIASMSYGSAMINCTAVVPSDKTAATNAFTSSNSCSYKNVAAFGCSNFTTNSPTITTCYTDDASPPSGATTATYSNQFQTTTDASRDFRLKSGAGCIDTGTTDATHGPIDIAGTARPSGSAYDVGAWEYVAAGSSFIAKGLKPVQQAIGGMY